MAEEHTEGSCPYASDFSFHDSLPPGSFDDVPHVFIVCGASGDLAKRKIYPKLWWLFKEGLLPRCTHFIGYARSDFTVDTIKANSIAHFKLDDGEESLVDKFFQRNEYMQGMYNEVEGFVKLDKRIRQLEKNGQANRIFYLALPPDVYSDVTTSIRHNCMANHEECWTRIILEKPFGRDSESAAQLCRHLSGLFREDQIYRMDHYLGKEMVQNLMVLRFGNQIFSNVWNRQNIASVMITFKETIGTYGRGGYFDKYGIIRDIMQNHLIQMLALVAMEKPISGESHDIHDEKVKVLRCIGELQREHVVLGQYVGNKKAAKGAPARLGYLDDDTVPNDSVTATFAQAVLFIKNERWQGVPFILRCGKALDQPKADVCIQFREPVVDIFSTREVMRDELIIRVQPRESVILHVLRKRPGMSFKLEPTNQMLVYHTTSAHELKMAGAYERLLLDVFKGSQLYFVRSNELAESWRIFTPLLKTIDEDHKTPIPYEYGSSSIPEADAALARYDFIQRIHDDSLNLNTTELT